MTLGRFDQALAEFNRAYQLNQLSTVANLSLGYRFY